MFRLYQERETSRRQRQLMAVLRVVAALVSAALLVLEEAPPSRGARPGADSVSLRTIPIE